ncbi:hypothetical protein V2J09_016816 [Rumex salicifolius]
MSKSRATSCISRLLHHHYQSPNSLKPLKPCQWRYSISPAPDLQSSFSLTRQRSRRYSVYSSYNRFESMGNTAIRQLLEEVEREKDRERQARKAAGINVDDEEEEDEDYMGVGPLIEKLEKKKIIDHPAQYEPTDSDSEADEEDPSEHLKFKEQFENKCKKHKNLLDEFVKTETLDDAFKLMEKIDNFELKHFNLRPEYRVIGELLNRFKGATGKEKFLLSQKLNRALRLAKWKEDFDPNNPANYGVIPMDQTGSSEEMLENMGYDKNRRMMQGGMDDEDVEYDDMKDRDNFLLEKLNEIDKQLEQKLSELEFTFGKKGKRLEEEIRNLAEERNSCHEKKKTPLYRKGFDVRLVDVNRTCKVTKAFDWVFLTMHGGQVIKYTAIMACGNYHGVVGFAKAKGPAVAVAIQKGYEKCFQNLHHVDLYENHTIAHAIQTTYKKTKIYMWPAKRATGMKAGRTVQLILNLAGYKNIKCKVIGSRNSFNTVKAVFKALNSIESPKDVQEKFGRTVVESYLL